MHRTLVLNVVGLTRDLLGTSTPNLSALVARGACRPVQSMLPAVTCPVQATYLTGATPRTHGVVANGFYHRELAEVLFWKQSHHLVGGEKVWEAARRIDPSFTCAQLFWWFNMYADVDWSATPRPIYCADGRKIPDLYTEPKGLGDELRSALGPFPLFDFWGPRAGIRSSQWIAEAARRVLDSRRPTLTFVYLPHLDYDLQRFGPNDARIGDSLRAIDDVCGELIAHAERQGVRVLVLSEYGIEEVDRPVHINRALREAGLLRVRDELGQEKLDAGASEAFAVADHQVAHVYVKRRVNEVAALLRALPGVDLVFDDEGKRAFGLDHPRSGELVAIAAPRAWFTYYYWLDDTRAPDFARTVDIHRKPGYDPAELFLDRSRRIPEARVAFRLAQKALGFRTLLDVIGLDASVVRGSHGRLPARPSAGAMIASSHPDALGTAPVRATDVKSLILRHVFDAPLLEPGIESRAAHPALET